MNASESSCSSKELLRLQRKKIYKPPSTINVGGMKFKVVFKEMDDFGQMDFDKRVIAIRKGLSPEEQLDTLIHEAHHAAGESVDKKIKERIG